MGRPLHIAMVASENDALLGGKVGGVADVLRDLPRALSALGHRVSVIVPSYGTLHRMNAGVEIGAVRYRFGGADDAATIFACAPREAAPGVRVLVLHHDAFAGAIYEEDPPLRPFERDAAKFARFCAGAGAAVASLGDADVLHCHDWHAGLLLLLRELDPAHASLRRLRTAFTIHNLSYQGTRPAYGHGSTFEAWFPELARDAAALAPWIDPRYAMACITPMAAGIRLADRVNTVSPRYAREILEPSDHARGRYGGEGLENALREVDRAGRLSGILNGIAYPDPPAPRIEPAEVWAAVAAALDQWSARRRESLHDLMRLRAGALAARPPRLLLTSVSRIVDQKVRLLLERRPGGGSALEGILELLDAADGVYVFQGSGEPHLESELARAAERSARFVFLRGYAEGAADALYRGGDLFLMPSSFEPCGIGQMLAMRSGQPCVVHAVGGLADTVVDGVTGFTFGGDDPAGAADAFVAAVRRALGASGRDAEWRAMRAAAFAARFTWDRSARDYLAHLYQERG